MGLLKAKKFTDKAVTHSKKEDIHEDQHRGKQRHSRSYKIHSNQHPTPKKDFKSNAK